MENVKEASMPSVAKAAEAAVATETNDEAVTTIIVIS